MFMYTHTRQVDTGIDRHPPQPGGDDDGSASLSVAGLTGQSRKLGGSFRAAVTADCANCPRIVRGDVVRPKPNSDKFSLVTWRRCLGLHSQP
jgi:hypothetical protein